MYQASVIALAAPPMSDDDYKALKADIRLHGLLYPIVLIGKRVKRILDGVHRDRACNELEVERQLLNAWTGIDEPGVEKRFIDWEPRHPGDTPIAFAASQHVRRNLTVDQRAIYAARLSTLGRGRPGENAPVGAITQSDAAQMMGVSRRSVQRGRVVVDAGIEELTDLVSTRKLSLGAAEKFAKLPENEALHTTLADKEMLASQGAQAVRQHLRTLDDKRLAQIRLAAAGQRSFLPPLTPAEQAVQDAAIDTIFRDAPLEAAAAKFQSRQNLNMGMIANHVAQVNKMIGLLPGFSHEQARILGLAWRMGFEKVKKKLGNELTTDAQLRIEQGSEWVIAAEAAIN